jgi:FkbH-like protein
VPDFPEDAAQLTEWFIELCHECFNALRLTSEDLKKSEQYAARRKVENLKSEAPNVDEFLKSLEMKAIIRPLTPETLPRVAQLTQKTNQFNLTTRRYAESDLQNAVERKDWKVYSLQLIDKFNDNGIVSVIILRPDSSDSTNWLIDTFLMSCRVIGRNVEQSFIRWVAKEMKIKHGVRQLTGEYIPTPKNKLVEDLFSRLGFDFKSKDNDDSMQWVVEIDSLIAHNSNFIDVNVVNP